MRSFNPARFLRKTRKGKTQVKPSKVQHPARGTEEWRTARNARRKARQGTARYVAEDRANVLAKLREDRFEADEFRLDRMLRRPISKRFQRERIALREARRNEAALAAARRKPLADPLRLPVLTAPTDQ